ncbi:uncharacterized protein LOC131432285 [Malaya genurostris]|uniref:uncharacterized protein LOC131432285 n=1 Tax=Malaya genurostris TaxID=325434 RepID=UPI0026F3D111|nr:uncharacterized protein LOC131432285 [Malaya genurostris]XP_058454455.1 uncharacterized protein LOC131432285 [Malaya genurostris]
MEEERKRFYLQNELLRKVITCNEDLQDFEVIGCTLETPKSLDGFMATMYSLEVAVCRKSHDESTYLKLLVKVMKGDDKFRRESLGLILFPNEINTYKNIVPAFKTLVANSKARIDSDSWCPRVYFAEQGNFPGYSDQFETILVMQNVLPLGFTSGPRLNLDKTHLTLMARKIAQFHACSYAMRILGSDVLDQLVAKIIPLNFVQDGKVFFESYDVVFRHSQKRLFKYFDVNPNLLSDANVRTDIETLREKYSSIPSQLMQRCLTTDDVYSVILHGDYNRNNVLFKYDGAIPTDVLMIDFQENRYGSPALDLSFFMYMNMDDNSRETLWNQVLFSYHDELFRCIQELTGLSADDSRLKPYDYENILNHLSRYFIYGAMIAVKFVPTMMASPDEINQIVHYFHNDIHAAGFEKILLEAGGEHANQRIANVMVHCSMSGYMSFLRD